MVDITFNEKSGIIAKTISVFPPQNIFFKSYHYSVTHKEMV